MPNTPTMNERAAQLAKLPTVLDQHGFEYYAHWKTGLLICLARRWNPAGMLGLGWQAEQGDYNHARLIYDRVVEMGLEKVLIDRITDVLEFDQLDIYFYPAATSLRLTAAQLTEACVEVLEEHERKERDGVIHSNPTQW